VFPSLAPIALAVQRDREKGKHSIENSLVGLAGLADAFGGKMKGNRWGIGWVGTAPLKIEAAYAPEPGQPFRIFPAVCWSAVLSAVGCVGSA
jgi:hypothetical protein